MMNNFFKVLDEAIESVEENDEITTFIRMNNIPFPIGPVYTGKDRKEKAKEYQNRLKNAIVVLFSSLKVAQRKDNAL